jgi:hypothetical protein
VRAAALAVLVATAVSLLVGDRLGLLFDAVLVVVCVASALLVRPRDFFTAGVLPPLLLGVTVVALTFIDRSAVARADDSIAQAIVSGLAHHAVALSVAYALTLVVIALRQVALRNHGALRPRSTPGSGAPTTKPPQTVEPGESTSRPPELPEQRVANEDSPATPVS